MIKTCLSCQRRYRTERKRSKYCPQCLDWRHKESKIKHYHSIGSGLQYSRCGICDKAYFTGDHQNCPSCSKMPHIDKLCECCGSWSGRKVHYGLKKLCWECFVTEGNPADYDNGQCKRKYKSSVDYEDLPF